MEEWIILKMKTGGKKIDWLEDFVELNEKGEVLIFSSRDEACNHREKFEIDGQVIELPLY